MKVALIPSSDLSYNSGSVIFAKNLFRHLWACGDEAFLLGSKRPLDVAVELQPHIYLDERVLEHPVIDDRGVHCREYAASINATVEYLLNVAEDHGIDVIHAHYGSFTSFAAFIVYGLTGIPYVVSSFGRDINIGYKSDMRIQWLIDKSFLSAEYIIVPDESIGRRLRSCVTRLDHSRIVEIPMPLDSSIFAKGQLQLPQGVPILATINSCFSPEKGIDTILTAFARVVQSHRCLLVVAGSDDHPQQKHAKQLESRVTELGIDDCVTFVGYLGRADVGELLRSAHVLVDARKEGNWSSTLLEAMFVGTAVIASDHPGARKVVTDGWNGLLFAAGDDQQLAKHLDTSLVSNTLLGAMRQNAKSWVTERSNEYTEQSCFASIRDVYRRAAATTPSDR